MNHRINKRIPEKNIDFCFIDYTKVFCCMDNNKLWKILRDGSNTPPYLSPQKPVCRSRSNMFQIWNNGLVPNWERVYIIILLI